VKFEFSIGPNEIPVLSLTPENIVDAKIIGDIIVRQGGFVDRLVKPNRYDFDATALLSGLRFISSEITVERVPSDRPKSGSENDDDTLSDAQESKVGDVDSKTSLSEDGASGGAAVESDG
jgi:hypothetical protein